MFNRLSIKYFGLFFTLCFLGLIHVLQTPVRAQSISEPVRFSHIAGYHNEPVNLQLFHPDPNAIILYTTDGSEPSAARIEGVDFSFKRIYPRDPGQPVGPLESQQMFTLVYSEPLLIQNRRNEPDRYTHITTQPRATPFSLSAPQPKATVIRARAFIPPDRYSETVTRSYFVQTEPHQLPVISINVDPQLFFEYENGIYVPGADFDNWRIANPNAPYNDGRPGNYSARGEETEHPSSFEFFENDGQLVVSQTVGLRLHGAWSRSFPMKSLRVYARSDYGVSRLNHAFFPDYPHQRFNRLILRHSGQDYYATMFRDAAIQAMVSHLNIETQAYRPTVHYLNGEFWGIINIRERYDRHYLERIYGVDPDNLDILTFRSVVKEGDNVHYNAMLSYVRNTDTSSEAFLQEMATRMDVDNFIDYNIANIFANNTDWPGNNIDYWRLRTDGYRPDAPPGHDGRWRWMLYDTDFGFNRYGVHQVLNNTLAMATEAGFNDWPNPDWSTFLFRTMLENPGFRDAFILRFTDLLNTAFLPERTRSIILGMRAAIEPEINTHLSRWQTHNRFSWEEHIDRMLFFADERPSIQLEHIRGHFELGDPIAVRLDVDRRDGHDEQYGTIQSTNKINGGYIRVNSIDIHPNTPGVDAAPYPWSGSYFPDVPLQIEAIALPGYRFAGWAGASASVSTTLEITPDSDFSLTAAFEPLTDAATDEMVLHGWNFNALESGVLETVPSDFGWFSDGVITYEGSGAGYLDRVSPGTIRMAADEETPAGYALRVRNPSDERFLHISISAQGFSSLRLQYAVSRTTNGAQWHQVWYRGEPGEVWVAAEDPIVVPFIEDVYQPVEISLSDEVAADRSSLEIKIAFGGSNSPGSSGNNRFDNLWVSGHRIAPVSATVSEQPLAMELHQNYPNPFNASTRIAYQLNRGGMVTLELFDALGRSVDVIQRGWQPAGRHQLDYNAAGLSSGVYVYRLITADGTLTRKMLLVK
ncbi:MAG: CotH kinase family protein [Bacteroidetes bacterium]|nr:CotH kinase family protein [Bacteroidota bacterium]